MCARDDRIGAAVAAAIKAEASSNAPDATDPPPRRRISLWEQGDSVHCSIVGTCADIDDLRRVARRVGIEVSPETPDYDVHGHFVRLSTTDNAFSRAFQKLLDTRFEGALRRVSRTRGDEKLNALWHDMSENGQVAPAYWAFMSHGHVPGELRVRIFGEVHMWSHLAGASVRRKTGEAAALRDQIRETEERARRTEAGLHDALAERDSEIARLHARIAALHARPAPGETGTGIRHAPRHTDARAATLQRRFDKAQRALQGARVRARQAEARLRALDTPARPDTLTASPRHQARAMPADRPSPAPAKHEALPTDANERPRTVLYVGGLHGHRDRLRGIAAGFNADFLHHDGGVEDAPQRLDHLLPSVDCVFCPVTCVSHDACLRAKRACQKLNTPFVPLRSAGQSAFARALRSLVEADDHGQVTGLDPLQEDTSTCSSP
ncbi:DUF2325 domain-containing protein [Stappia sp. ES.058]|uniref:DUF2325 domain-containing protein n=1 Tax=Stappia sp. ES.058 TaxID=1881061 RepID=UPI00087C5A37|nr:DUF2325 domain-containing protein [Stappia sp. ES.058]SDU49260.1 hypothetical protein SAMN05428979_4346 [Stappia sp. ES.058]